jgi:hypothetical protein
MIFFVWVGGLFFLKNVDDQFLGLFFSKKMATRLGVIFFQKNNQQPSEPLFISTSFFQKKHPKMKNFY